MGCLNQEKRTPEHRTFEKNSSPCQIWWKKELVGHQENGTIKINLNPKVQQQLLDPISKFRKRSNPEENETRLRKRRSQETIRSWQRT